MVLSPHVRKPRSLWGDICLTEDFFVATWDHLLHYNIMPKRDILDILAAFASPSSTSTIKVTRLIRKSGILCCPASSFPLQDPVKLTVDGTLFYELNLGMICTIICHWLDCHMLGLTLSHLQSEAKRFKQNENHTL